MALTVKKKGEVYVFSLAPFFLKVSRPWTSLSLEADNTAVGYTCPPQPWVCFFILGHRGGHVTPKLATDWSYTGASYTRGEKLAPCKTFPWTATNNFANFCWLSRDLSFISAQEFDFFWFLGEQWEESSIDLYPNSRAPFRKYVVQNIAAVP